MRPGIAFRLAGGALCGAAAFAVAGAAFAQAPYPSKPVRLVVPSSPGGGTDITARLIAPGLSERLGQKVVVENRAGAGTMIGGEVVAKAAPDGYTLLMGLSTLAINPAMYQKVLYDTVKDFAPITQVISAPNMLVVHPVVPAKTVKELIAVARARPGQLNYASAGQGTNPHLSMELFLAMTGTKMVHIPYKGLAPGIVDLLAGHVTVATATMLTGLPHVRSGRLRILGTTGAKRAGVLPDIPTVAEAGVPGYEASQWYGVLAPARTPQDIIAKLHAEIVHILQSPDMKKRLAADGTEPVGNSPAEFARYIGEELVKWAKVAKAAGIKPE
jgi:tripartite-type tricarboxylate transporter receptor subunit TctC